MPKDSTTRPVEAIGEFGQLPVEMVHARRWLVWKSIPQPEGKKPRKVPYYVDGTERRGTLDSPEDQARYGTFTDACKALATGAYAGLGFALGPDGSGSHWQGVDLDDIKARPGLVTLMEVAPGYVERSPSGNGFHAIGYGQPFASLGSNATGIEAYAGGRYFTVTGDAIGGAIEDLSAFVVETLRPIHKPRVEPKTETPHTAGSEQDELVRDLRSALRHLDADDRAVWIATGLALKTLGARGRALWLEWSSTSTKFDADDAAARWEGFKPTSTDYRAIFAEAQRCGWSNPKKRDRDRGANPANDAEPEPEAEVEPETEPETRLRLCDLSDLRSADLDPPEFIINPLIPRGHLTLFGGHGGSGKTTLGLVIAAHVACGRSWAGLNVASGRVLFMSYEDNEALTKWRLKNIATHYVLNLETIARNMAVYDATEAAPIEFEVSDKGVKRTVLTTDGERVLALVQEGRFDLVIIDNASDAFDGDENSRRQVRGFVRRLSNAVRPHNGAVVLMAHIDKSAARYGSVGNSYSGSTGWHNSARSRLALVDDELHQEKLNVGKKHPVPIPLTWVRSVPVPSSAPEAVAEQAKRDDADDAAILACFAAASEAGDNIPASETGQNTYVIALRKYPECADGLRNNKDRLKAGVTRLLRAGQIRRETYKTHDRKDKQRLVVSEVRQCAP